MSTAKCTFAESCVEVDCSAATPWLHLSELSEEKIKSKCFPNATNVLEVLLLKADLFFQHRFDLSNASICDAHHKFLFRKSYFSSMKSKCDTCVEVRGVNFYAKADLRYVIATQAITLFKSFRMRNSYGKLICRDCREKVAERSDITRFYQHQNAFLCIFDPDFECCTENASESSDIDYEPLVDDLPNAEIINEKIKTLNDILSLCGSKKKVTITNCYEGLSHRVKLRYRGLVRFIVRSVASLREGPSENRVTLRQSAGEFF